MSWIAAIVVVVIPAGSTVRRGIAARSGWSRITGSASVTADGIFALADRQVAALDEHSGAWPTHALRAARQRTVVQVFPQPRDAVPAGAVDEAQLRLAGES